MARTRPFAGVVSRARRAKRRFRGMVRGIRHRGEVRFCPICEREAARFLPFGRPPRDEALCPYCGSLERHRLLWLYFARRLAEAQPRRFLHVAPEQCMEGRLMRRFGAAYTSADLVDPGAQLVMDLTAIDAEDGAFDGICCSHVLEHIPDDRAAMRELARVLAPRGWLLVQVPVWADVTFEDPQITTAEGRRLHYGHPDHKRAYGPDIVDRLADAGLQVDVHRIEELVPERSEVDRMRLTPVAGDVYLCRPRVSAGVT